MRGPAARACRAAGLVLPVAAITLTAGLYFSPLLPLARPQRYLGGDFASYFYPVFRYVAEEVAAGRLPHWTPYVGAGYPLLADIESCVLYPPIRLLTAVTGPPGYLTLELYAIAHYVVAGVGTLVFARGLGLGVLAASVAAMTFMLSGFEWAHSAHLTIIQAAAWVPWLLAAHGRALARPSAGATVAAGAVFALLLLGGHPQIAFYAALATGLHAAVATVTQWRGGSWRRRAAPVLLTGLVLLLGLGLAAPQLLPTAALGAATSRWHPTEAFLSFDTLPPHQLLTMLVPLAYLGTDRFRSMDEFPAYVGIGPLLLAAAALALRRDAATRRLGLLVAAGFALALAPLVPGVRALAAHLPVIGLFRASARAMLLTDLGAAGLAGLGFEAWAAAVAAAGGGPRVRALVRGWRVVAGAALAGWGAVLAGRLPASLGPLAPQFADFYGYFVLVLLAHLAVLELWRARRVPGGLAAAATVGLVLLNLTFPHRALPWSLSPPELAWQRPELARRLAGPPGRERIWNEGWLHRRGQSFEANAGLLDRLEILTHYTSLPTARFNDFTRHVRDPWREPALVDLLNVRYLVLDEADTAPYRQARYAAPRLLPGEERRYETRALVEEPIGAVTVVLQAEPDGRWASPPGLVVTAGPWLDVCLGCRPAPAAAARPAAAVTPLEGGTIEVSAVLPSPHRAGAVRLHNALLHPVTVRELRLDELDLYAAGLRYRQLGPNLWENVRALPRAFLVEEVLVEPDTDRIVPTLLGHDARRLAVVERAPACAASLRPGPERPPDGAVALLEYEPTRVRLRTRHPRPAFLVLTDAHASEWRARVDGAHAGISYVDLLFRGVCVPAGEHVVEFSYRPHAFRRGIVAMLLAAGGAAGAVVVARRYRPAAPGRP